MAYWVGDGTFRSSDAFAMAVSYIAVFAVTVRFVDWRAFFVWMFAGLTIAAFGFEYFVRSAPSVLARVFGYAASGLVSDVVFFAETAGDSNQGAADILVVVTSGAVVAGSLVDLVNPAFFVWVGCNWFFCSWFFDAQFAQDTTSQPISDVSISAVTSWFLDLRAALVGVVAGGAVFAKLVPNFIRSAFIYRIFFFIVAIAARYAWSLRDDSDVAMFTVTTWFGDYGALSIWIGACLTVLSVFSVNFVFVALSWLLVVALLDFDTVALFIAD